MHPKKKGLEVSGQLQLETSFVPEILIKQFSKNPKWKVGDVISDDHSSLLWVDIASFSPLCNRLMKDTLSGVEKLTAILNSHYDFILNTILENGGQPLFFVGDGLISVWPGNKNEAPNLIVKAIACANHILNNRDTVDDIGNLLSLHTVVTFGTWKMAELTGIQDKKLLSYYGDVFKYLAIASKNRAPNQVLIYNLALSYLSKNLKRKDVNYNTSILLDEIDKPLKVKKTILKLTKEEIQKIKKFTPSTLSFPLSKERMDWMAEIRPVSIIFIKFPDIEGNFSNKLHQMAEVSKLATPLVIKYEGLLYQIWMDDKTTNMLICFGPYPTAHDDNPERSVKLAFELNALLKDNKYENSIGISTGMGYCGILGNNILRQYTVIGDVVNQSARISDIALNNIICDQTTYNATKKNVVYSKIVKAPMKGHSSLVQLYPVDAIIKKDKLVKKKLTSIGREKELQRLIYICNYIEDNNKNNSIVIIEGDNGMGKSQLLADFNNQQLQVKNRIVSSSGDFLARKTPYNVWSVIFSNLLGLKKIETGLNDQMELDRIAHKYRNKASLLNIVLNTAFPDSNELKTYTPSQKVSATHDLLLKILREETKMNSLIIQIDDAQWMDETCWCLIESVNSHLKNCTVILCFAQIKGIDHINVSNLKNYEKLNLYKFSRQNIKKLICRELGVSQVSDEVIELIKKIAKGNPFFSLEFLGSLEDQQLLNLENDQCCLIKGAIINELSLPETVRGALRRRLDRLDQGSQLSVKVGSVVGNRFSKEIVSKIYPIETERAAVASYLYEAKNAGFLSDTLVDNNSTGYRFNNTTTAEVAYEMTLATQRRYLHRASASWYEENFKNNLQPFYVRLAHHWLEAGEKSKALYYYEKESIRLHSLGFVRQGLEVGLEGVQILNYNIEREPENIGPKIAEHMSAIADLMANRSIESLVYHKKLENKETEQLIKMLLYLSPLAHQCNRSELFALMPILSLRITLEQGNGVFSAEVYSMYSIIHKALTGDSHSAFAWSNLALAVDDNNDKKHLASVGFIHGWFIAHWLLPIKDLIPLAHKYADAGFVNGDILFACFNLSLQIVLKVVSGQPLETVINAVEKNLKRNNQSVITAAFHLIHEKQVAKAFQGKTNGYTSLSDDLIDETKDIASICDTDMYNQISYYYISKLKLHVHYGNWEEAIEWGEKASKLLMAFANQPGHFEFEQFYTIAALYRATETENDTAIKLITLAHEGIEKINAWAKHCPSNFLAKALMVKAIKKGIDGEITESEQLFKQAVFEAKKHGFTQDCGLAYEHLMRLQKKQSLDYKHTLISTRKTYDKWGALAKINYIKIEFDN